MLVDRIRVQRTRARARSRTGVSLSATSSLDTLIARQGGKHVLYGSALTLAAAQT